MADKERELQLKISANTTGVKQGMAQVQGDLQKLESTTKGWGKSLSIAANSLDVKPMRQVNTEVNKLRAEYDRLKKSGLLTQKELAQASGNLKTKTAQLRGQQSSLNKTMKEGSGVSGRLTSNVKNLVGAYLGFRAVSGIMSTVVNASKDAETAQFNLTASVQAASREFENTGGLDVWQGKIEDLSSKLKIYSETDVANAAARTLDMTKRLGLSADQMETLIERTADLSAGKTDLEGGIERVTAALRGEAESAEFLGLTLSETYVKGWYETNTAHEKAWKDLTDLEKAQIRYQVVLEQSAGIQGKAADSASTFSGALQMVQAEITNAITKNADLNDAMTDIAKTISANSDEIGEMATTIASAIGEIVNFTLENKKLIATLIGSGGLVMLMGSLSGAITNVGRALKTVGGIKTPAILGTGGGINAALVARIGLYGTLAATIVKTVAEYNAMRDAQGEAAAAADRLAESQARVQGIADAAADSTGLEIDNIRELNQLIRDGVVVRDQLTGQYLTQQQAQEKSNDEAQREIQLATERATSFAEIESEAARLEDKYGDLSAEALNASKKQDILDAALSNVKTKVDESKQSVEQLAAAYFDAATALEDVEQGEQGYQAALDRKLEAEKSYVDAVAKLREQQLSWYEDSLDTEETALENSLEKRMIELERWYNDDLYTKKEYDYEKLRAEEEHAEAVLSLRQQVYEKAAELYGEDALAARDALAEVQEAENDLARQTENTRQAFDDLYVDVEEVGEAGRKAGREASSGIREIGIEAGNVSKQVSSLNERMNNLRTGFYGKMDDITNTINSFDSLEDLQNWSQQKNAGGPIGAMVESSNLNTLLGNTSSSPFANALNRHAKDLYFDKLNELSTSSSSRQTTTSTTKQMTVNLKAPGGETVAGSFAENDAGALLEILRKAGLTTA